MKKISFLFVFLLLVSQFSVKANPVVSNPILVTELHFDANGDWTIELLIYEDLSIIGDSTLDNFRITALSGSSQFNPGMTIHYGDLILITNNDLQTPLTINKQNDLLQLEQYSSMQGWFSCGYSLMIGNYQNWWSVPPVLNGQSVHLLIFTHYYPVYYQEFYYAKSNVSGLGSTSAMNDSCRGILSGHVYDAAHHPVPPGTVWLDYFPMIPDLYSGIVGITDSSGSFSINMYARINLVRFRNFSNTCAYLDTLVAIEPDSVTNLEITLDTLLTGIPGKKDPGGFSLSNYPNPFEFQTNILVSIPSSSWFLKAIIKVYDSRDEIVALLPVSKASGSAGKITIPCSSLVYNLQPGIYLYSLEIDGKRVASNKMILTR